MHLRSKNYKTMSIKYYSLEDFQKHQNLPQFVFLSLKSKFLLLFILEILETKITQDLIFPIDHSWLFNNIKNMPQFSQNVFYISLKFQ